MWPAAWVLALGLAGCHKQRPEKVPGETDLELREVSLRSEGGQALHLDVAPLLNKLGLRKGGAIYTHRYYNPFRLIEDRRRVQSYWQTGGYYEAEVLEPEVEVGDKVTVRWVVREGPRYELAGVEVRGAPAGLDGELGAMAPSRPGQVYDLEAMRVARYAMAARVQRAGHGHARVYSRAYVDRGARRFHWVYFVDAGPLTRVRSVRVEGAKRLGEATVLRRSGLAPGLAFGLDQKERAEFDLLDSGSFASASVDAGVDVEQYVGDVPDPGGVLGEGQIDEQGNLVPRPLSADLDVVIRVVESPKTQVKLRASIEADPTRADAVAGGELWRRDLGGGPHHLVIEGRAGYGHLWKDDAGQPSGLYGEALVRSVHPGLLGRVVDGRVTARYRDTLYPGFHLRELTAGPGLRSTLATGVFLDLDAVARRGQQVGLGEVDAATREALKLPERDVALGLEVAGALVSDQRNDPAEPTSGHLLSLRATLAPGGPVGTHRYLLVEPEARGFLPLSESLALGVKASGGWAGLATGAGVPQGARFFGGGAYGFRGTGRDRLSPTATRCLGGPGVPPCSDTVVGGLSLAEGSVELRYLPPLKQAGLTLFVDAGGASGGANPFARGLSAAVGLGPRVRLWYLPISIEYAYGFLTEGKATSPRDSFLLFFRIGEAFLTGQSAKVTR